MPIPVTCQCGYQVNAPDQYAGQEVPCPSCQNPLQIPQAQQPATDPSVQEMLSDAGITAVTPGGFPCPNCTASIAAGGIICIECGFNVESGQMMGVKPDQGKKSFGGAVYTHRSYGSAQLDRAAEVMEVELFEGEKSDSPTPYWVWLFIFLNVISFGMGLALFSLTYFSLSGETLKIALYSGTHFENVSEEAALNNYFLVVSKADLSPTAAKPPKKSSMSGMDSSATVEAGTYCTVAAEQNGYSRIRSLNGNQDGWVPTVAVISVTPSQIRLLIKSRKLDLAPDERPVTDKVEFAFFSGLGTYSILEFWLGLIFYGIAHVTIALWAFKDELVHALLATLVPVYNVVWCFMRWKYVGGYGIMATLGLSMIIGSIIAGLFVPALLPTVAGSLEEGG